MGGIQIHQYFDSWASLGDDAPTGLETFVLRDPAEASVDLPASAHDLDAELEPHPVANPDRGARAEVRSGDPLVYIYTSGTTGLPKAAKMSHLRFNATGSGSLIAGFTSRDTMYCALPLYHSAGGAMAVAAAFPGRRADRHP